MLVQSAQIVFDQAHKIIDRNHDRKIMDANGFLVRRMVVALNNLARDPYFIMMVYNRDYARLRRDSKDIPLWSR
jgi:hypothetical protein